MRCEFRAGATRGICAPRAHDDDRGSQLPWTRENSRKLQAFPPLPLQLSNSKQYMGRLAVAQIMADASKGTF